MSDKATRNYTTKMSYKVCPTVVFFCFSKTSSQNTLNLSQKIPAYEFQIEHVAKIPAYEFSNWTC